MSPPGSAARSRCLTDAEIAAVHAAPPGRAPEDLARHLASCERCQQRALFGEAPHRTRTRPALPGSPSIHRALIFALLVIAAMVAFVWSLGHLVGPAR